MNLPLVFIPGMMCDGRVFGPQINTLSAQHPIHLAHIGGCVSIANMAQSVLDSAPAQFALAGLSLGGIVAMEIMRQAPERIHALALLDTNPRAELAEVAAGRQPQIEAVQQGNMQQLMEEKIFPNYLADQADPKNILSLCWQMAETMGPDVFVRQSHALATRADAQDVLQTVKVPCLILMGHEDKLCPLDRHVLMHELIPHSHLEIIEGAGHLPTLEQPSATNAALENWIKHL